MGKLIFIADLKSRVVGFIVFNMEDCDDHIGNTVVSREEKGKGIGRALVEHVEKLARSKGFYVPKTATTENAQSVPWKGYDF